MLQKHQKRANVSFFGTCKRLHINSAKEQSGKLKKYKWRGRRLRANINGATRVRRPARRQEGAERALWRYPDARRTIESIALIDLILRPWAAALPFDPEAGEQERHRRQARLRHRRHIRFRCGIPVHTRSPRPRRRVACVTPPRSWADDRGKKQGARTHWENMWVSGRCSTVRKFCSMMDQNDKKTCNPRGFAHRSTFGGCT